MFGDGVVNPILIIRAVRDDGGKRFIDLVEQGTGHR
jgi:hypothetical protein